MTVLEDQGPLAFFKLLHRTFGNRLAAKDPGPDMIGSLLKEAFDTFEGSTVSGSDDLYTIACRGGCANCCTLRVAATAPEVFLIARAIKASHANNALLANIQEADAESNALDEIERMTAQIPCPLIAEELCAIYAVRPLAYRGHASYDQQACIDALAGLAADVPVSELHLQVRSLIQNALQSALRDAGYSWALYELNAALIIALLDETCESKWKQGKDVFASAMLTDVSLEEMAETFEAIKQAA